MRFLPKEGWTVIEPLKEYQLHALEWLSEHPKSWLAMEQGLGKTRVALEDVKLPAVAIVPAFLRLNWIREAAHWKPGIKTHKVDKQTGFKRGVDLYVMSYESAAILVPPRGIETLILDESRFVKNHKAARTKRCMHLAQRIPRVRLLDGTPVPNRPSELWSMGSAIGMTRLNWRDWGFRYCAGRVGLWGGYDFRGQSNIEELRALWAQWAFRRTKEEAGDLPPKMRRLVLLDGTPNPRERQFDVGELKRNPNPTSFVGLAEVLHEHGKRKIGAAVAYIDSVLEHERPILVTARHTEVIKTIAKHLGRLKYKVGVVTGDTPFEERETLVDKFNMCELDVLVGNTKAIGAGLTMTGGRYGISVEADWSYGTNVQVEDRLHRIGQELPVQWDYLVIDRSIDENIVRSIMHKESVVSFLTSDNLREDFSELGL